MRPAELVVHLGLPGTWATPVGKGLSALRDPLRDRGVALVRGSGGDRKDGAQAYAARLRRRATLERQRTVARRRVPQTVLVTDAGLLGPATANGRDAWFPRATTLLGPLVTALAPARTTLLLVTRRQDRWLERQHHDAVLDGASAGFDAWASDQPSPSPDWLELADRLGAVAGVDRVQVLPVEVAGDEPGRLARHVLGVVGVGAELAVEGSVEREQRRTTTARGLAVARGFHAETQSRRERRWVRDFVLDTFPGSGEPELLDAGERRAFLEAAAGTNRRLLERHAPAVPPTAYADEAGTDALTTVTSRSTSLPVGLGLSARAYRRWDRAPARLHRLVGRLRP